MNISISPELAILYATVIVAAGAIAFLYKKHSEAVRTVLEEKIIFIDYSLPFLEAIQPHLPPETQAKVREFTGFLKWWKAVNEALLASSPTEMRSLWLRYESQAPGGSK